jgi:hypothetical protein
VRFELTTSALPRRRSVRWSYRGDVPGAGLEPACADFKDRPGCQQPTPEWSRLPVPTRVSCLTGAGSQPCATARHRRKRWRSFPLHGPTGVSVLTPVLGVLGGSRTRTVSDLDAAPPTKLGYEDMGAATRCRPGPSAVRGRSRSRARRRELGNQDSNLNRTGQSRSCCRVTPFPIECARRDLNPHARRHRFLKPGCLPVPPPALGALGAPPGT